MKRFSSLIVLALVAGLVGLVGSPASAATTRWVNDDDPNGGGYAPPGTSCDDPGYATIQAAVNAAASGETINVCPGTYAETVTLPAGLNSLTIRGTDPADRPLITEGFVFDGDRSNLSLEDLRVTRTTSWSTTETSVIRNAGILIGLTFENVEVDGQNFLVTNVMGLPLQGHGVSGGQIQGAVDVHDSQFVNIKGWAVFDTRSGSSGPTTGSLLTTFDFSDNYLANNAGHVVARSTIGFETQSVTISGNTVEDYPDAPASNSASVFKVFYSQETSFTDNVISNIGILQASIGGAPYGSGLMPRNAGPLTVTGNTFDDSVQGIAFEPRNTTSGGFPDGVISGGTVDHNHFTNNMTGIFVRATNHPSSTLGSLATNRNELDGNTTAINNESSTTMNAQCNWWGSSDGPGPVGPGTGDPVSNNVDYSLWLVTADLDGACIGDLSMGRKQAVRDSLEAKQATADEKDAKRIAKAIEHIDKSLNPKYWDDATHLDPKEGKKVFEEEKKAVKELTEVENTDVTPEILEIVDIDRDLAQTEYDEAPPGKEKDKAGEELMRGDMEAAMMRYASAIEHYKKAWEHAVKAQS